MDDSYFLYKILQFLCVVCRTDLDRFLYKVQLIHATEHQHFHPMHLVRRWHQTKASNVLNARKIGLEKIFPLRMLKLVSHGLSLQQRWLAYFTSTCTGSSYHKWPTYFIEPCTLKKLQLKDSLGSG